MGNRQYLESIFKQFVSIETASTVPIYVIATVLNENCKVIQKQAYLRNSRNYTNPSFNLILSGSCPKRVVILEERDGSYAYSRKEK